jgi:hypothetical protein
MLVREEAYSIRILSTIKIGDYLSTPYFYGEVLLITADNFIVLPIGHKGGYKHPVFFIEKKYFDVNRTIERDYLGKRFVSERVHEATLRPGFDINLQELSDVMTELIQQQPEY